MNHLVFLDTRAGELERILSGVKSMVVRELGPARPAAHPVRPGDSLYFLRDNGEYAVRVQAAVLRVLPAMDSLDLPHTLKEMQPRLQLTESQYNCWSGKKQVLLVEFTAAHKIPVIHVASNKLPDRSDWIAFKEFSLIT